MTQLLPEVPPVLPDDDMLTALTGIAPAPAAPLAAVRTQVSQMLTTQGADRIALLSDNPDKAAQLAALGVEVTERVPTGVHLSTANARYLRAKREHTSHTLDLPIAG